MIYDLKCHFREVGHLTLCIEFNFVTFPLYYFQFHSVCVREHSP